MPMPMLLLLLFSRLVLLLLLDDVGNAVIMLCFFYSFLPLVVSCWCIGILVKVCLNLDFGFCVGFNKKD